METLFKPGKDDKVADLASDPGFDTEPLLKHFGPDVTWRQVFLADPQELMDIPGYGPKTEQRIHTFICENLDFSFMDFLNQ